MFHQLEKPGIVFMETIHSDFIPDPQKDEQRAGQPGGKSCQVDSEVTFGSQKVTIDDEQVVFQHGLICGSPLEVPGKLKKVAL
jgi:hypothetical protein